MTLSSTSTSTSTSTTTTTSTSTSTTTTPQPELVDDGRPAFDPTARRGRRGGDGGDVVSVRARLLLHVDRGVGAVPAVQLPVVDGDARRLLAHLPARLAHRVAEPDAVLDAQTRGVVVQLRQDALRRPRPLLRRPRRPPHHVRPRPLPRRPRHGPRRRARLALGPRRPPERVVGPQAPPLDRPHRARLRRAQRLLHRLGQLRRPRPRLRLHPRRPRPPRRLCPHLVRDVSPPLGGNRLRLVEVHPPRLHPRPLRRHHRHHRRPLRLLCPRGLLPQPVLHLLQPRPRHRPRPALHPPRRPGGQPALRPRPVQHDRRLLHLPHRLRPHEPRRRALQPHHQGTRRHSQDDDRRPRRSLYFPRHCLLHLPRRHPVQRTRRQATGPAQRRLLLLLSESERLHVRRVCVRPARHPRRLPRRPTQRRLRRRRRHRPTHAQGQPPHPSPHGRRRGRLHPRLGPRRGGRQLGRRRRRHLVPLWRWRRGPQERERRRAARDAVQLRLLPPHLCHRGVLRRHAPHRLALRQALARRALACAHRRPCGRPRRVGAHRLYREKSDGHVDARRLELAVYRHLCLVARRARPIAGPLWPRLTEICPCSARSNVACTLSNHSCTSISLATSTHHENWHVAKERRSYYAEDRDAVGVCR